MNLGNAYAMLARNLASHFLASGHDAAGHFLCMRQHVMVVGVHGNIDMAVAVAGVHMACNNQPGRFHVVGYAGDGVLQPGVLFTELLQKEAGPFQDVLVRDILMGQLAHCPLGNIGEFAVELLVLKGEALDALYILQGPAVGLGGAFQVDLLLKFGKFRHPVYGDDHVLVHLEA